MTDQMSGLGAGQAQPSIELHIDELILHGFLPGDRDRIGAAVQHELVRLLSEQGLPATLLQGGERPSLEGGSFELRPQARPEAVGTQVARSIFRGLSK